MEKGSGTFSERKRYLTQYCSVHRVLAGLDGSESEHIRLVQRRRQVPRERLEKGKEPRAIPQKLKKPLHFQRFWLDGFLASSRLRQGKASQSPVGAPGGLAARRCRDSGPIRAPKVHAGLSDRLGRFTRAPKPHGTLPSF